MVYQQYENITKRKKYATNGEFPYKYTLWKEEGVPQYSHPGGVQENAINSIYISYITLQYQCNTIGKIANKIEL